MGDAAGDGDEAGDADAATFARLRELLDAGPHLAWMVSSDGGVLHCNRRWLDYTGRDLDGLRGDRWEDVVHPDDRDAHDRAWARAFAAGTIYEEELRLRRRDGVYRWHALYDWPVLDGERRVLRWYGTATDVDDRRHALDRLHASEQHLRLLVECAREHAIFTLDGDGVVASWNPAARAILGFEEQEIVGRSVEVIFTEDDRAAGVPRRELAIARHRGMAPNGRWHVRRDGTRFYASGALTALVDRDGRFVGFSKILCDRTDEKAMEERLTRANDDLGRFATIAAHDLQEPLRTVIAFLELLGRRAEDLDARSRSYVDEAVAGAQRMRQLIRDLLELARVHRGDAGHAPVDARAAVDEAVAALRGRVDEIGAEVAYGDLPCVDGNRTQIVQLFQNLIGNALKYRRTDVRTRVEVVGALADGLARFSVRDNGVGIAPEDAARVFDIFARLQPSTGQSGTGIGLAICRAIVEAHGGRIWVEPGSERGATFVFELRACGAR